MGISDRAWKARENSRPLNGTAVGCAITDQFSEIWTGCNIELEFRLGMHAEVNALSRMIAEVPEAKPIVLLIACPVAMFTPCGACMDWIMQLGGPQVTVMHERAPGDCTVLASAEELMPFYPRKALQRQA